MDVSISLVLVLAVASCGVKATNSTDRNCRGYTRDGRQCSLPFIYKGVSYHTCTDVDNPPGRYWCSLTPDFDADKQWKRCAGIICDGCKVYSTHGRQCIFPFVYKGKTYNYCTNADNGDNLWCAHSSVYNGQWGKCGDTLCGNCTVRTEGRRVCKFPFTYKRVQYDHCTMRDNKRPWCSLNGHFRRRGVDWDNCKTNDCPEQPVMPVVPLAAKDKNSASCTAKLGYSSAYSAYTVNGNKCALPFIYKGVSYPSVTDVDNKGVKWCSLTPNFDRDRRWEKYFGEICSGCTARTDNNRLCHFPFEYKSRNYTYCTKADNPRLWCSFDPVYTRRWGRCTDRTECPAGNYLGCFQDNESDSIIEDADVSGVIVDNEWCIAECREKSYKYAGATNGTACYCGYDDNYSRYGHCVTESDCACDSPCPGNNTQMCGGNHSVTLYSTDCLPGKYGKHCELTCHCKDGAVCEISTGQCPNDECAPDWYGPACNEECVPGTYGEFCNMTCHCIGGGGCNVSTGRCPNDLCAPLWLGPTCNDADRRYLGCIRDPNSPYAILRDYYKIMDNITIEECVNFCRQRNAPYASPKKGKSVNACYCGDDDYSYRGTCGRTAICTCNDPCPGNSTQMCGGDYGYSVFSTECMEGTYGQLCELKCHCKNGAGCDIATGQCPNDECAPDWYGPTCNLECMPGKYGPSCNMTCHCKNGVGCKVTTGQCPNNECAPDWVGPTCNHDLKSRYLGCFPVFNAEARRGTLTGFGAEKQTLTLNTCVNWCGERNWKFAGAEGSVCLCGNDDNSQMEDCQTSRCKCDMPCEGDRSQECGGADALSIYETVGTSAPDTATTQVPAAVSSTTNEEMPLATTEETPEKDATTEGTPAPHIPTTPVPHVPTTPVPHVPTTPVPHVPTTPVPHVPTTPVPHVPTTPVPHVPTTPVPHVPTTPVPAAQTTAVSSTMNQDLNSRYLGCFNFIYGDGGLESSGVTLNGENKRDDNMTLNMCIDWCTERNYKYAGAMAGGACICGNEDYTKGQCEDECICDRPCGGNSNQICGGRLTLSIYATGISLPTTEETPVASTAEQGSEAADLKEGMW